FEESAGSDPVQELGCRALFELFAVHGGGDVDRNEVAVLGGAFDLLDLSELLTHSLQLGLDFFVGDLGGVDLDLAVPVGRYGRERRPQCYAYLDLDSAVDVFHLLELRIGGRSQVLGAQHLGQLGRNRVIDRLTTQPIRPHRRFDDRSGSLAGPEALQFEISGEPARRLGLGGVDLGVGQLERDETLEGAVLANTYGHDTPDRNLMG